MNCKGFLQKKLLLSTVSVTITGTITARLFVSPLLLGTCGSEIFPENVLE
jgi:hypothetical protein